MPLYLQNLNQDNEAEPIIAIETTGDLMSERCWSGNVRGKLCQ
ncbi:44441_t:CDS:2 [Gigaspora margarita]|uniref:44441_t:CDS:1 n=1 Tax=Gigaspora margarita TaxID=4874 RepID=A0ABM8W044_GIGMA|nr:44441_t:CDS:2 [Gigaspora margarita]